jgi:hypothetical protein
MSPHQQPPQQQMPDAAALIARMTTLMGDISAIVEQETALVRAGKISEATKLESAKTALSQDYLVAVGLLKNCRPHLAKAAPSLLADLRRRHDDFSARLQINLTVLVTAHAVSESIMRGVQTEMARKSAPQTYGASGQHSVPSPRAAQPMAVSRVL